MNIGNFIKSKWAECLLVILFLGYAVLLNIQFLQGSNLNYKMGAHDEYLTVREVYSILHPLSLKHFFMAFISGDVLYYGRMVFYLDAAAAFIPERMFGIEGMVFAIRMFHSVLLAWAMWILANTFIADRYKKLLFLAGGLFTYYSFYFASVPKPEPLQLLLIAIFLKNWIGGNFSMGRHFIWLGAAYGVKFNVLMILPLIGLITIVVQKIRVKEALTTLLWFAAGLVIAVPCLILAPVKPVFLNSYLKATFFNTGNIDDDPNIGLAQWLGHVWPTYYSIGVVLMLVFFGLAAVLLLVKFKTEKWKFLGNPAVIFTLSGLMLNLPVVLLTKRLYPHYLWTGVILMWLGLNASELRLPRRGELVILATLLLSLTFYFIRSSASLLSREGELSSLIHSGKKAYDSAKNLLDTGGLIVMDQQVYYPFNLHVRANPYHPFASQSPAAKLSPEVIWTSAIDSALLADKKPDLLLLSNRFRESLHQNQSKAKATDLFIDAHYSEMEEIGDVKRYKKVK